MILGIFTTLHSQCLGYDWIISIIYQANGSCVRNGSWNLAQVWEVWELITLEIRQWRRWFPNFTHLGESPGEVLLLHCQSHDPWPMQQSGDKWGEFISLFFPKSPVTNRCATNTKLNEMGMLPNTSKYHHGNITKKLYHVTQRNGYLSNRFSRKQTDAWWRFCLSFGMPCPKSCRFYVHPVETSPVGFVRNEKPCWC